MKSQNRGKNIFPTEWESICKPPNFSGVNIQNIQGKDTTQEQAHTHTHIHTHTHTHTHTNNPI